MTFWLQFRILQSWRMLQRAGIGMVAVAVLLMLPFGLRIFAALENVQGATLPGVWLAAIGMLHGLRGDRLFLEQGKQPVWQYASADYLLLSVVTAILGALTGQWLLLGAPVAALWVVLPPGWLRRRKESRKPLTLPRWIPAQAIEWYFLLRGLWPGWLIALLLILGTAFHFAFYLAAMATGLFLFGAAFEHLEPFSMFPDTREVYFRRWRAGANTMYGWLLPGIAILLVFQTAWWPLGAYVVADYELFWFFALNYKYASWAPGRQRLHGSAAGSVAMLFALIPGGIIGLAMMAVWFGLKAKRAIML